MTKKAIAPGDRTLPWVIKKLKLNALRRDGDAQPRHGMMGTRTRRDVVTEYATAMKAGAKFPPITAFYDGENYWPADGFHRMAATEEAGLDEVPCEVRPGTRAEAQWFSYSANQSHGLQRNNRDKESAVMAALRHPKGVKLSNKQIAEHVGVSHPFVGGIRRKMEADGSLETVTSRTGADGRTIDTSNIGKQSDDDGEIVEVYEDEDPPEGYEYEAVEAEVDHGVTPQAKQPPVPDAPTGEAEAFTNEDIEGKRLREMLCKELNRWSGTQQWSPNNKHVAAHIVRKVLVEMGMEEDPATRMSAARQQLEKIEEVGEYFTAIQNIWELLVESLIQRRDNSKGWENELEEAGDCGVYTDRLTDAINSYEE